MEPYRLVLAGMRSYDLLCRKMAKDLDSVVMSVEYVSSNLPLLSEFGNLSERWEARGAGVCPDSGEGNCLPLP